ncbi:calphotin-like [Frankliniella occidentalis]|uniref:Calphotin-like n=1 Tax=Frankliniella occidentalis TaxID=133901 RepID=A0A9C6WYQ2_FRAOC|nr:calphotin-like [Frankliniella occidentalis]
MKGLVLATVLAVLATGAMGGAVRGGSSPRQARWFLSRADVTEVVEEEKVVTQVTPWSCVVVAPSLPPCRHVRQLNIAATPPTPIAATAAPMVPRFYGDHNLVHEGRRRYYLEQGVGMPMAPMGSLDPFYNDMVPVPAAPAGGWVPLMAREATEPLPAAPAPVTAAPTAAPETAAPPAEKPKREEGWAQWLGLRAYTVTSTLVKYATTKVVDPDTVVTFSVRGCQPSKLPFDLPLCVAPPPAPSKLEEAAPAVEVSPAAPSAPAAAPAPVAQETSLPVPVPAPTVAPAPADKVLAETPADPATPVTVDKPAAPASVAPAPAAAAPAAAAEGPSTTAVPTESAAKP